MTNSLAIPAAVLFDRDGTLIHDVPYNADPDLVVALPSAPAALAMLRERGIAVGVVSNQPGIGRGRVSPAAAERVNARVDELLGPFDVWRICPHVESDRCPCRKPAPGLVLDASAALGVPAERVAVIGDIGSDVAAAQAAGARAVLVPTAATRAAEVCAAPAVAPDLTAAVELLVGPAGPAVAPFPGTVFESHPYPEPA